MSQNLEYCCACGEPTGKAGAGDGSIYVDLKRPWYYRRRDYVEGETIGPLCPYCYRIAVEAEVIDET